MSASLGAVAHKAKVVTSGRRCLLICEHLGNSGGKRLEAKTATGVVTGCPLHVSVSAGRLTAQPPRSRKRSSVHRWYTFGALSVHRYRGQR